MTTTIDASAVKAAQDKLDAHVREIMQWHFSPETGCPFWLEWAQKAGWNPPKEVKAFADLLRFPHFQDEWLRDLQPRSEEHTSELQSLAYLVCRLLLEKKKKT